MAVSSAPALRRLSLASARCKGRDRAGDLGERGEHGAAESRALNTPARELWVCFSPPPALPEGAVVLSFMPPGMELASQDGGADLVSGRAVVDEVREEARREYVDLIARVGATPIEGRTLRQALRGGDGVSRWWFVKVSEKDPEWEGDLYTTVLRLVAIRRTAERLGAATVRCWGAPADFHSIVTGRAQWGRGVPLRLMATGLGQRLALLARYVRLWWRLRRLPHRPVPAIDVLLQAQWGWSLRENPHGGLEDRYFTRLPRALDARGLRVGWLAVCETGSVVRGPAASGVEGAAKHPQVVLAERHLRLADIVAVTLDLRPLVRYLGADGDPRFRRLFTVAGFDVGPALRARVLTVLAGSAVPRLELVATATARACTAVWPRVFLAFLELLLQSRAMYVGVRRARPGTAIWAAQHAGYGRGKLFGVVEPRRELRGEPDGCPVPAPDGIFVMGDLSAAIWRENGFPEDRVVVTGGLRYEHVRIVPPTVREPRTPGRVLLVGSLVLDSDLDMCDAASAAAAGLPLVLEYRDHPAYRLTLTEAFAPFHGRIGVSRRGLEEDLANADLVIFTHSSVGEEAILRGLPAWQWSWAGVNESVFADLAVIPRFMSARALREALKDFLRDPAKARPDADLQMRLLRECFSPDPARAADAIAGAIEAMLAAGVTGREALSRL